MDIADPQIAPNIITKTRQANPLDISPLNLRIVLVKQVHLSLGRCIFLNILTLLSPLAPPGA